MKSKFFYLIILIIMSCKSSKIDYCQFIDGRPKLNVNSYEDLINYGKNTDKELEVIVLDGYVVNKEILEKFIFNNSKYYLVDFMSLLDANGKYLDGPPVRVIVLKSNLCGKLKFKKNRFIIKE